MDYTMLLYNTIFYGMTIIGGATILFRTFIYLSEKTASNWDNNIVNKFKIREILEFLSAITEVVSLNKTEKKVIIDIKERK